MEVAGALSVRPDQREQTVAADAGGNSLAAPE
jgi:hypothetical protein